MDVVFKEFSLVACRGIPEPSTPVFLVDSPLDF
jgi:hypothetical protein